MLVLSLRGKSDMNLEQWIPTSSEDWTSHTREDAQWYCLDQPYRTGHQRAVIAVVNMHPTLVRRLCIELVAVANRETGKCCLGQTRSAYGLIQGTYTQYHVLGDTSYRQVPMLRLQYSWLVNCGCMHSKTPGAYRLRRRRR
jgi:hypothetical protein